MRKPWVLAFLVIAGCARRGSPTTELDVFAAASLRESFTTLAHEYERAHPGSHVVLNLAGSQDLALQIDSGAPCDVFASADRAQMRAAEKTGRIRPADVQPMAANRLVLVFRKNSIVHGFSDVDKRGVKLVLAASSVPVGAYSLKLLRLFPSAMQKATLSNVVSYEQDVRAVLAKVDLGEADAGIVYATDAKTAHDVNVLPIPKSDRLTAQYYIAPVEGDAAGAAFARLVLSRQGQSVLAARGFMAPSPNPVRGQ